MYKEDGQKPAVEAGQEELLAKTRKDEKENWIKRHVRNIKNIKRGRSTTNYYSK